MQGTYGDHPGAASVYGVNSIELITIIKQLNGGFSQAGKSIKTRTNFVIGCTFNPNAKNLEAQVQRLERKVAGGAQFVMTQPVFDVDLVKKMHGLTSHLPVAMFTGVWPLLSSRQAEFLHHEVPGIIVSDAVRAEMAKLDERGARAYGMQLAQKMVAAALGHFAGVYLIAIFALRVNDRAGEICAKPLKRAESRDVENTAEAPFANRRRLACHHAAVGRLAFLTSCRSCLEVARTRDALGGVERSLLSAAFRTL